MASLSAPPGSGKQGLERRIDSAAIQTIVDRHHGALGAVIAMLEDVQALYGYLPEDALRRVADLSGRSLVEIYGVATFYRAFSLKPRGRHVICACLGTACHVRGGPAVVEEFERQLGIRAGETTSDGLFTLETVNCLGACALGPVVVIDGRTFSKVRRSTVRRLLNDAKAERDGDPSAPDPRIFSISARCPHCDRSLMEASVLLDGHPSIRVDATSERGRGWLRLSSLYGRYTVSAEQEVPLGSVVELTCPHCGRALTDGWECPSCGARMASFAVDGGATARVCTRRGCRGHMLDLFPPARRHHRGVPQR
jgi:NADH:ubiquinone oxidoreductase subunit E